MNIERNLLEKINAFVLDKHLTISDVAYFFEMETEINETFLEVRELLAQPEQEPEAWKVIDGANGEFMFSRVKPMERTYKYDVVIPLYTSPLKTNRVFYQEGYAQAELDLKREPLGLEIMDACGSEDYREGFKDGALYAEKAHGITGGGE